MHLIFKGALQMHTFTVLYTDTQTDRHSSTIAISEPLKLSVKRSVKHVV